MKHWDFVKRLLSVANYKQLNSAQADNSANEFSLLCCWLTNKIHCRLLLTSERAGLMVKVLDCRSVVASCLSQDLLGLPTSMETGTFKKRKSIDRKMLLLLSMTYLMGQLMPNIHIIKNKCIYHVLSPRHLLRHILEFITGTYTLSAEVTLKIISWWYCIYCNRH